MIAFSVIIPNYNHAAYLPERIDSVLFQTYRNFEVIILDDCSTDSSRQIIESYKKHQAVSHIILNQKNSGSPFLQWIRGIQLAKNEWIWIAESDDFADPEFLHEAAKSIQQHGSVGLFYCDGTISESGDKSGSKRFSDQKNKIFKTNKWDHSYSQGGITEINECLKFDNTVNNVSGVVFKKELLAKAVDKLQAFTYYGDWYCYFRLCLEADIYYCNKPLNMYRKHSKSFLNAPTSSLISRREYFMILQLLYYNDHVTNKKQVIDHFCFHYLTLGLFSHSLANSFQILKTYFQIDNRLARKVVPKLLLMKLFRKRYKTRVRQVDYVESNF